jgi:hypothetical protein
MLDKYKSWQEKGQKGEGQVRQIEKTRMMVELNSIISITLNIIALNTPIKSNHLYYIKHNCSKHPN